jgi:hypothetical protein
VVFNRGKQSNFSQVPKCKWLLHEARNPIGQQAWFRGKGVKEQDPDGQMRGNGRTFFHALLGAKNRGLVVFMKDREKQGKQEKSLGEMVIKSKPLTEPEKTESH